MQILRGLVVLGILLLAACGGGGGSSPANSPPVAEFSVGCDGLTCTLTDLSTDSDGSIEAHVWEFGDGGSSTEPNPTHTYADSGTFRIRLTVTDDDGEADTIGRDVTTTLVQTVTYERETAHGSPDRHSRYLLHSDGRFELHDIRGAETVVYQGSWTLHDPDFPWIDLDFDEFSGGECAPPGFWVPLGRHWSAFRDFRRDLPVDLVLRELVPR